MSAPPVVRARAAAVGYDGEPVVEGIDLELAPGTTLGLLGAAMVVFPAMLVVARREAVATHTG